MKEYREDDDMSQAEKDIIINAEIAKLLGKATEYRKIMPSDKYSLETLSEKELGKFIHGQKWPVETTPTKKLKSKTLQMEYVFGAVSTWKAPRFTAPVPPIERH